MILGLIEEKILNVPGVIQISGAKVNQVWQILVTREVGASTNGSSVQGYVGHQMGGSHIKMKRPYIRPLKLTIL